MNKYFLKILMVEIAAIDAGLKNMQPTLAFLDWGVSHSDISPKDSKRLRRKHFHSEFVSFNDVELDEQRLKLEVVSGAFNAELNKMQRALSKALVQGEKHSVAKKIYTHLQGVL